LSLALEALDPQGEIDVLMGIGGAPEGVLSAAAALCMGGENRVASAAARPISERPAAPADAAL
jgi:fructose-1,6-bisphosphatase/sedoheptulose 1,7-bisphosphatase-like protein